MSESRSILLLDTKKLLSATYKIAGYYTASPGFLAPSTKHEMKYFQNAQEKIQAYMGAIQINPKYVLSKEDQQYIGGALKGMLCSVTGYPNARPCIMFVEDKFKPIVQDILQKLVDGEYDEEVDIDSATLPVFDKKIFTELARIIYPSVFPGVRKDVQFEEEKSVVSSAILRPDDDKEKFIRAAQELACFIRDHKEIQENAKKPLAKQDKKLAQCLKYANEIFNALAPFAEEKESQKKSVPNKTVIDNEDERAVGLKAFYESTINHTKNTANLRPKGAGVREDSKVMKLLISGTQEIVNELYPECSRSSGSSNSKGSFFSRPLKSKLGSDKVDEFLAALVDRWQSRELFPRQYYEHNLYEFYKTFMQRTEEWSKEYNTDIPKP